MSLILDPSEVADPGRVELDLYTGTGPIYAKAEGIDWGDTALEIAKGSGKYGDTPLDWKLPNRVIRVPLVIKSVPAGDTMIQAMGKLQAKVSRLATEGGTLKRVRKTLSLYADVVTASVVIPDTWTGENKNYETEGEVVLECLPDFYGAEVTLNLTNAADGYRVETWSGAGANAIKGNYPGRARITLTDTSSGPHRGIGYAFRARNYSSAATAAPVYEAETLELLDQSALTSAISGASGAGNNCMRNQAIGSQWTPVTGLRQSGGTYLTHVGTYRVYARVYATSDVATAPPSVKLSWSQGDLIGYNDNVAEPVPGLSGWYLVDLGEVRLDKPAVGNPRWHGVISAIRTGASVSVSLAVDRIFLQPRDECGGIMVESPTTRMPASGYSVNDPMNQTAGNMVGKTAVPAGAGNYSALIAGGTDFQMTGSGKARRSSTGATNGALRVNGLALGLTDTVAQVKVQYPQINSQATAVESGLIIRGGNSSGDNALMMLRTTLNIGGSNTVEPSGHVYGATFYWELYKRVSGAWTLIDSGSPPSDVYTQDCYWFLRLSADRAGKVTYGMDVWAYTGSLLEYTFTKTLAPGAIPELATGGALESGGVYLWDQNTTVTPATVNRDYDDLQVYTSVDAQTMYSGRSLVLDTKESLRQSSDGNGYGPVVPIGDVLRIPVAGKEQRTVECFLFSTQSDLVSMPDSAIRNFSAQLKYRPCWLSVPEA